MVNFESKKNNKHMELRLMNVITPENSMFSKVFRYAGVGMAILDGTGRIVDVNPAMQDIFGRPAQDLLRLASSELLNPENSPAYQQGIDSFFAGHNVSLECDQIYRHEDGGTLRCKLTLCRARDIDGPAIVALFDPKPTASGGIRQAEIRYRGLFENAVEGIFQSTPCGRYLAVNPALAKKTRL